MTAIFDIKKEAGINLIRISLGIFCVVFFALLSFVRKIAVFAKAHLWSNCMILLTLVSCVVAGSKALSTNGSQLGGNDLGFINTVSFTNSIGFSVYAFEGIGIILPI